MVPDGVPIVLQQVAKRLVVRLAGQYIPIRFDAHIIQSRRAAFHSQIERHRIKVAVLGRRVPDKPLAARFGLLMGHLQQCGQLGLCQSRSHRGPAA
jgi:hypothetical protein